MECKGEKRRIDRMRTLMRKKEGREEIPKERRNTGKKGSDEKEEIK